MLDRVSEMFDRMSASAGSPLQVITEQDKQALVRMSYTGVVEAGVVSESLRSKFDYDAAIKDVASANGIISEMVESSRTSADRLYVCLTALLLWVICIDKRRFGIETSPISIRIGLLTDSKDGGLPMMLT